MFSVSLVSCQNQMNASSEVSGSDTTSAPKVGLRFAISDTRRDDHARHECFDYKVKHFRKTPVKGTPMKHFRVRIVMRFARLLGVPIIVRLLAPARGRGPESRGSRGARPPAAR